MAKETKQTKKNDVIDVKQHIFDVIEKAMKYHPAQHLDEIVPFLEFCLKRGVKRVLEIGSLEGGLSFIFSELFEEVVCIDINHTRVKYEKDNIARITLDTQKPYISNKEFMEYTDNRKFDLIFIDGLHTEVGVSNDYKIAVNFINPTGIIAFHDIKDTPMHKVDGCYVADFIKKEKFEEFKNRIEFVDTNDTWLGEKIHRMDENGGILALFND